MTLIDCVSIVHYNLHDTSNELLQIRCHKTVPILWCKAVIPGNEAKVRITMLFFILFNFQRLVPNDIQVSEHFAYPNTPSAVQTC